MILACLARHFPPPTAALTGTSKASAATNGKAIKPQQQQPGESDMRGANAGSGSGSSAPAVQPVDAPASTATAPAHLSDPNARFPSSLQAVCIVSPHPFASLDAFVASSAATYGLDLSRYTLPMRQGLEAYLRDRPCVKAVFVGTRRTDPHGEKLTFFDPTDRGWPQFVRVHPVIDWHYGMWHGALETDTVDGHFG